MNQFRYDLHLHSCLSACAQDDMTPANIAGFARLEGLSIIAVTDHNSALNLPATARACKEYGVGFVPGIEVTSAEEIHLLCYFKQLHSALAMGEILQKNLPFYPYERNIFGNQLVVDEDDNVTAEAIRLLSSAVLLDMYEVKMHCEALGGLCVPAHINRSANSLLSVLGVVPEDFFCPVYEWSHFGRESSLSASAAVPPGSEILVSSDAHCLQDIGAFESVLTEDSFFWRWLQK